ncbi:MAG: DUF1844 domain-containing protein [Syntrophaceae bacterium]|nr:DUF1844 domain-containing protein [Syntrophaceae bacterium]
MEEKKKDSGFVVKDKRLFGDDAKPRPQDEEPSPAKEKKETAAEKQKEAPPQEADYPPITFANFVLSLSTSALYHFGDFPDPEGGKTEKNLSAVKQTIDILDMLHGKTKGNLDENETQLIEGVLYELKLRFVKEKG